MARHQQPLPPDPPTPTISSRPSKRVPVPLILSSFPAPPSHIPPTPSACNPPPTGPPTDPLPPLPSGPSRISEHEQLFILSSVRSRRSSNYSQRDRDSIASSRSPSSLGRSVSRSNSLTTTTPTTPSPLQHTRMPVPLSDISDSDAEAVKTTTSPVLSHSSPRRLLPSHQPNDSISSIDMRDVLGVYADDIHNTHKRFPSARHIPRDSIADPVHPDVLLSALDLDHIPPTANRPSYSPSLSPSRRSNYPLHSPHKSPSESCKPTHARSSSTVTAVPGPQSQTQTPIQSHKHSLSDLGGIVVTKTTTTTANPTITTERQSQGKGRGSDHMTLDELSSNKQDQQDPNELPNASTNQPSQSPRVPSPDIATILSIMPRPALSLSRSRSGADTDAKARSTSRSKSRVRPGQRRVVSVSTNANTKYAECHIPNLNRRQSESALATTERTVHPKAPSSELAYLHKRTDSNATKPPFTTNGKKSLSRSTSSVTTRSSVSGYYDQEVEDGEYYDEALERVLEGEGSEDEGAGVGMVWDSVVKDSRRGRRCRGNLTQGEGNGGEEKEGDSDSSLDLHTPLPHLMLRHGLLSPNSKLLPQADCSRAATPLDGRPGSILSVVSNGSVMTKSGLIKDERDTVTRRVRHRDGKLLRGGIGLTTGLGWSDSEDEDAPSPLTRRLSSLNLSRRSSASSVQSETPPLSSSSSLRRIHPLSRSYSSGAILETEREHDEFRSFDEYSSCPYDYDEDEEEEEEDRTIEETGHWAQRYRLGQTSPPASVQRRRQPPPSVRSRNRRNYQIQSTARTSTGSIGSGFSLEVTIPEGSAVVGEERSKTPSRLRRPSSHTSFKSSSIGVDGGGGRESSGSSSLDSRFSGFSNSGQHDNGNYNCGSGNKEKSLPPLPAGGLKKKTSGNQISIISNCKSSTTTAATTATAGSLNGTGKYAFPSSRIRTFSSSTSTSTPSPSSPTPAAAMLSPSSSAATIKPNVRPLQLPRQTTTRVIGGDRPAVPVPSPTLNSLPLGTTTTTTTTTTMHNSLRAPTSSLSTLPRHRPSPITPILSGTSSAPASPAIGGDAAVMMTTTATGGMVRPKPRTGTGMVYRTSSYGVGGSKMRAPMILSGSSTNGSGGGNGGSTIGGSGCLSGAIAL